MRQLDENMVDRGNPAPFHHGPPRLGNEGEAVGVGEQRARLRGPAGPGGHVHARIH